MNERFEVVPVSDLEPGDSVTEPVSGVVATVRALEPAPDGGWRVVLDQVWCLHFEVAAETPVRRLRRS